jgi:hypothetical protein
MLEDILKSFTRGLQDVVDVRAAVTAFAFFALFTWALFNATFWPFPQLRRFIGLQRVAGGGGGG